MMYQDTGRPIVMGYKGGGKGGKPEGRTEFGLGADWNHRTCRDCGCIMSPTPCPDNEPGCMVWHGWTCEACSSSNVDHEAFEASMSEADYEDDFGFFYCPYIPKDLK